MRRFPIFEVNRIFELPNWRRWLVTLSALIIVLIETVEHKLLVKELYGDNYLEEVILYGLILVLAQGLVLSLADRAAAKSLASAVQDERQNIVREIHDSIAQNIGYLRLKLESLISTQTLDPETIQELEQAQEAASEAYEQIRGTLLKLDVGPSTDFTTTLYEQARDIGRRAKFSVDFAAEGVFWSLPLDTQLVIIYIFREVLLNVEKHAGAQKIRMRVIWQAEELTVQLSDDGRGFDAETLMPDRHWGLKIMQARAAEINARFAIRSRPGAGTEVALRIPLI